MNVDLAHRIDIQRTQNSTRIIGVRDGGAGGAAAPPPKDYKVEKSGKCST